MSNEFNMADFFVTRSEVDSCHSVLQEWLKGGKNNDKIKYTEAGKSTYKRNSSGYEEWWEYIYY